MSAIYDPALSNCTVVTLSATGQTDTQPSADCDVHMICRALCDQQGVDNFCLLCQEESFACKVKALDFSGAKLSDAQVAQLLVEGAAKCSNILELNLSYIPLSHKAVAALCSIINVKISGYCSLQRLYVSRTSLDFKNCKAVLSSCLSNIVLKQLVLSGNRYMRLTSECIVAVLADPENRFVSLNMGNCGLDCGVLKACCPALGRHPFLRELQLNSNDFGDDGGEILFSNLVKGNCMLENISLDRCKFESCRWAVHLPQLASMHTLSLSYNNITDTGLQELCRYAERSFSMRSLSLASNAFGERAICLGSLLQCNPGLIHLDVSGNMIHTEAVESIAFGVLNNKTMLRMNMSNCVISSDNAMKLCKSLLTNPLMELDLSQNPVDKAITVSARGYAIANQHLFEADSLCPVEYGNYNRLSFNALERAEVWREEQRRIFAEVKLATEIVAAVTGMDVSLPEDDSEEQQQAGVDILEESKEQSSAERPGTADVGENLLSGDMGSTLTRSASTAGSVSISRADTTLERSSSAGVNSQSKGARRRKNAKEEEGTVITVSYGPRTVILGTIRVPTSASYANVRGLIHPLVAEYYERLKQSADEIVPGDNVFRDTAGDMTDAFRMVDPYNVVVDREAEGSRILLSELYGSEFPTSIVVRPTTWLQLPDDEDDDYR